MVWKDRLTGDITSFIESETCASFFLFEQNTERKKHILLEGINRNKIPIYVIEFVIIGETSFLEIGT